MVVQWFRLGSWGLGLIPGQETKEHQKPNKHFPHVKSIWVTVSEITTVRGRKIRDASFNGIMIQLLS